MQIVAPGAGVASRFRVRTRAHRGDPEGGQAVPKGRGLPRGEDDAHLWEGDPHGDDELGQIAVGDMDQGLELSRGGTETWRGDGEEGLPADGEQFIEVSREREGLLAPIGKPEQGPQTDSPETGLIGASRAGEAPVVVLLRAGEVHRRIDLPVVGLLVDNEPLCARLDDRAVVLRFHRADLEIDRGHAQRAEAADAFSEVVATHETGVLSGDEEKVPESLLEEMADLGLDLVEGKRDAEDGVLPRKPTVAARVDALVREVERGKKSHGGPEVLARQAPCIERTGLELGVGAGLDQAFEMVGAAAHVGP